MSGWVKPGQRQAPRFAGLLRNSLPLRPACCAGSGRPSLLRNDGNGECPFDGCGDQVTLFAGLCEIPHFRRNRYHLSLAVGIDEQRVSGSFVERNELDNLFGNGSDCQTGFLAGYCTSCCHGCALLAAVRFRGQLDGDSLGEGHPYRVTDFELVEVPDFWTGRDDDILTLVGRKPDFPGSRVDAFDLGCRDTCFGAENRYLCSPVPLRRRQERQRTPGSKFSGDSTRNIPPGLRHGRRVPYDNAERPKNINNPAGSAQASTFEIPLSVPSSARTTRQRLPGCIFLNSLES